MRVSLPRPRFVTVLAVLLSAVLAVSALVPSQSAVSDESGRSDEVAVAAIRSDLADTTAELVEVVQRSKDVRAEIDVLRGAIDADVDDALAAISSGAALDLAIDVESQRLDEISAFGTEIGDEADLMARCAQTLAAAVDHVDSGRRDNAVASLAEAAAPCEAALAEASGAAFPFDFPDPFVLATDEGYYAYSTNAGIGDVQTLHSADLENWTIVGNSLGPTPEWALSRYTWAPAVIQTEAGYTLYYTVAKVGSGRHCISQASSVHPAGPFLDSSAAPLVCDLAGAGSIDPSPFRDTADSLWLAWSEGGATDARIVVQRLSSDGTMLVGERSTLIVADKAWERGIVEGPSMLLVDGTYHLLYSAASWRTRNYAVGHAVCSGPAGPCTKPRSSPVLSASGSQAGPGGQTPLLAPDGTLLLAYHAYVEPRVGYPHSRTLHFARLDVLGQSLRVITPTG